VHVTSYIAWCQSLEYMELYIHALNIPPRRAARAEIQPSCLKNFQAHTMATSAPWQAQMQLSLQPCPEPPRVGMAAPGKPIEQAQRSWPHSMDVASDFIFITRNSNKMSNARRVTKESKNQFGTRSVATYCILYKPVTVNNEPLQCGDSPGNSK
jgi:hypothetical protein